MKLETKKHILNILSSSKDTKTNEQILSLLEVEPRGLHRDADTARYIGVVPSQLTTTLAACRLYVTLRLQGYKDGQEAVGAPQDYYYSWAKLEHRLQQLPSYRAN